MIRKLFYISLTLLIVITPRANAENSNNVIGTSLSEDWLKSEINSIERELVQVINDPIYTGTRCYTGVKVINIINQIALRNGIARSEFVNYIVRFIASDKYKSEINYKDFDSERAYLALGENPKCENNKEYNTNWTPISHPGGKIIPGPNALIWSGFYPRISSNKLPIVYSTVRIELVPIEKPRPDLPPENSGVFGGYELFKKNCQSCHSVNKVGGAVGPELNIPFNITEYMDTHWIKLIVKNANAVRWGSKMPKFQDKLDDVEIDQIIKYLSKMRLKKICYSEKSCAKNTN